MVTVVVSLRPNSAFGAAFAGAAGALAAACLSRCQSLQLVEDGALFW